MGARVVFALWMMCFAVTVASQTVADTSERMDESAPQPPIYSKDRLIPIEMPPYVTLQVGVDPETIDIGTDGVLRYVVVMRNASGSTNVAYEGIRCANGDVKTYARVSSAGDWVAVKQSQWRAMTDNIGSRHAHAISQQGGCDGPNSEKREDVIKALKSPKKMYN